MNSLDNDLAKIKLKLDALSDVTFDVYSNGIFNALDVDESIKDKLIAEIKKVKSVNSAYADYYRNDNGRKLYRIHGKLSLENINEEIEIHDTLNPKIWKDKELLPGIKEKIEEIVELFVEQLAEDGIELKVDDIHILGSNANYNYTENSDLDVHIIADESFDCSDNHLDKIYNAYKTLFNRRYDIKINGINLEIYVENKADQKVKASGIYSLKDGWIKDPANFEIPAIDNTKLDKEVGEWENRYLDLLDNPKLEAVDSYIDDIYDLRKASIESDGEFGLGNLIFKEIRRLGYLDALKDLKDELQGKALSL